MKTKDASKCKTLQSLFDGYDDDYKGEPYEWGEDVGREVIDDENH